MEISYDDILKEGTKSLKKALVDDGEWDAWYLFEEVFSMKRAEYFLKKNDYNVDERKYEKYRQLIERRSRHIPLQYITGTQEFMGLVFYVDENVLIPRQDTELLVETVLHEQKDKNMRLLDMCTGSGCIAISLKKLGSYEFVEGADLSNKALQIAKKNASSNDTEVIFRESNLFECFSNEKYDIIVSNPPYIPSKVIDELMLEVRGHEPVLALDGREDGLYFYRKLAAESKKYLNRPGYLYLEIGHDQGKTVPALLLEQGYCKVEVLQDLAGKDRVVKARL